jgi:K+-sensing histidine kinase KdpD
MDSYDILVIILSITLAVFLTLAIIATSLIIKLLKQAQEITATAQQTVDNVEEFTSQLKSAGKVTAVGSAVAQVIDIFKKGRK